jgi:DNA-binding LacI/PurR family transcriptional regulator
VSEPALNGPGAAAAGSPEAPARRPTIVDVARAAGVSKSLVSLVMRDAPQVSAAKRERVRKAADELGYRMNFAARSLSAQRSGRVGVLVADLRNPTLIDVVEAAAEALEVAGLSSLVSTAVLPARRYPGGSRLDVAAIGTLNDLRVDGMLIVGSVPDDAALVDLLGDLPVVVASGQVEGLRADTVRTDDLAGMRLLVEHLAQAGHHAIAHLGGLGGRVAANRLDGYRRAMTALGLADQCLVAETDFTEASGYRAAAELLRSPQRPTALVGVNDLAAVGAMSAVSEAGLDVAGDVAITGYDDSFVAAINTVSLTSVNPNTASIASLSAGRLLERIGGDCCGPSDYLLAPKLVTRNSTSAAPPTSGRGRR